MTERDEPAITAEVRAEVVQSFDEAEPGDKAILAWYFAQPANVETALKDAVAVSGFTERGVKNRAPIAIRELYARLGESLVPTARARAEIGAVLADRNPPPPEPEQVSYGTMVGEIVKGFSIDDPSIHPRTSPGRRR